MSEVRVSMETIRRVYDDDNGCFLEVGPDADALGCVELRCVGKENVEYWGELRLLLPKGVCRQVGGGAGALRQGASMTAQTRLTEIAESLHRGEALQGAMTALDGWEARNIGAQRMRMFLADARAWLAEAADEIGCAQLDLIAEHEAMAQELERRPVRMSVWARIFGVNHE